MEAWRREYNEERPKKALDGMTSLAYAKQSSFINDGRTLKRTATENGETSHNY